MRGICLCLIVMWFITSLLHIVYTYAPWQSSTINIEMVLWDVEAPHQLCYPTEHVLWNPTSEFFKIFFMWTLLYSCSFSYWCHLLLITVRTLLKECFNFVSSSHTYTLSFNVFKFRKMSLDCFVGHIKNVRVMYCFFLKIYNHSNTCMHFHTTPESTNHKDSW